MNKNDDVRMDYEPADNPGLSMSEQYPDEFNQEEPDNDALLREIAAEVFTQVYGAYGDEQFRTEMTNDIYLQLANSDNAANFTLADVPALIAEHKEYNGIA